MPARRKKMGLRPGSDLEQFISEWDGKLDVIVAQGYFERILIAIENKELPESALAFEFVYLLLSFMRRETLDRGYWNALHSEEDDYIAIPLWYLEVLEEGWERYRNGPPDRDFAAAFGLEPRGQGKRPVRDKVKQMLRDFRITWLMHNYLAIENLQKNDAGLHNAAKYVQQKLNGSTLSIEEIKKIERAQRAIVGQVFKRSGHIAEIQSD